MTPRRRPLPPPTPEINLLIAILQGTPYLDGASCRGRAEVFDAALIEGQGARPEGRAAARAAAKQICAGCPALAQCADWVRATPEGRRPAGIIAGRTGGHPSFKRTAAQHNPEGAL